MLSLSLRFSLITSLMAILLLSGCQSLFMSSAPLPAPVAKPLPVAIASHEFSFDPAQEDVVGTLQITTVNEEDTLSDIARRFNLGYEEIVSANPGVDPWIPKVGTPIVLPTQFILPEGPRRGIVINLAAMRLFYFPPKAKNSKLQKVITHPLGIGRVEWKTPQGTTSIIAKKENPAWIPTASIRKEHAANGSPLPAIVPPGPDNPMGTHVLRLGWTNYAIHGTDKPPSIGLRGSHGCLRMYPEDITGIYDAVPVGTPVRVVNQPHLLGWRGDHLYLQTYPILEDDKRNHKQRLRQSLANIRSTSKAKLGVRPQNKIDPALLKEIIQSERTLSLPITQAPTPLLTLLDQHALKVQNTLPRYATWSGDSSQQLTVAEIVKMAEGEP
ncbi:MAG: LysM peptidoglycan-binding domain-containing protein [Nitrosomonas sp.]|nr:MAG: LysM peptidoglycan-binding domain-containing protein [Nitrosomonas sp.]